MNGLLYIKYLNNTSGQIIPLSGVVKDYLYNVISLKERLNQFCFVFYLHVTFLISQRKIYAYLIKKTFNSQCVKYFNNVTTIWSCRNYGNEQIKILKSKNMKTNI